MIFASRSNRLSLDRRKAPVVPGRDGATETVSKLRKPRPAPRRRSERTSYRPSGFQRRGYDGSKVIVIARE
jgi:hypothetical protein